MNFIYRLFDLATSLGELNWNGSFLILIGVGLVLRSIVQLRIKRRLHANGIEIEGTVVQRKRRLIMGRVNIYPIIRFTTLENKQLELECSLAIGGSHLQLGEIVRVIYDSKNPVVFSLKEDEAFNRMPVFMLVLAIIMLISGLLWMCLG